jgi:hypothetical protein
MDAREIVDAHIRGAKAFEAEEIPEETVSESSTVNVDIPPLRPQAGRNATWKSTSSKTPQDVDALVRILSRRSTRGQEPSESGDHEGELEDIMGGIFGDGDDDISKRKKVGVIWKHLTVCLMGKADSRLKVSVWGLQ